MERRYNEERALSEAEGIKDLVGKSGTKADYVAAEKLVEEESKKEQAEIADKKVSEIFNTYRSIIGALDRKEIDEIALNYNGDRGYSFINRFGDWEEDRGVLFRGTSTSEHDNTQNGFVDDLWEKKPGEWENGYAEGILEVLRPIDQIILTKGKKEFAVNITEASLDEFVKEYSDILQKIEGVKTRAIGPERQIKLLENLESERKRLHDTMALKLQKTLKKDGIEIGQENARHLLALVYEMRKNLLQNDE